MSKIGICTLFTGFNYGSALQAYAVKSIVKETGFEPIVFAPASSFLKGRNITLSKAVTIIVRRLTHLKSAKGVIHSYLKSPSSKVSEKSKKLFIDFYSEHINPIHCSYSKLKRIAGSDDYFAFVCGSDQIWSSTVLYVDKRYYLRFCDFSKRIAFAPSLGSSVVPNYNKRLLAKYISQIRFISIREDSGRRIVKELTNRDSTIICDPTLLLSKEEWCSSFDILIKNRTQKKAVIYFLDEISADAQKFINRLSDNGYEVIYIGPKGDQKTGPIEFLEEISTASYVVTDSFHGTAFAINFNVPFATFSRQYKTRDQSTRIVSLLEKTQLLDFYNPTNLYEKISFDLANEFLINERIKAKNYLLNCFEIISEDGKENENR